MQIIKKQEQIGKLLFYIAIGLELFIMMTDQIGCTLNYRGRIAQLAFLLFGCKISTTFYNKKEWFIIVLAGMLGIISYFTCEDEYVLRAVMMILAAKNIDIKKTLKFILIVVFSVTVVMMILSLTGVYGELIDVRDYGRGSVESRWKFGFSHPNNIHDIFWYMLACYLLIRNKNTKWKEYIFFTIINIGLFILTRSRNGMLASQILLCAAAVFKALPIIVNHKWPYYLGVLSLIGCVSLTILAGSFCINQNEFNRWIDRIITGRMEMVWEFAPVSSWVLFPGSRDLMYVDNGFASIFYIYGLVVGITYLFVLFMLFRKMYNNKDSMGLSVLVTTILVTFMERTFVFNVSLLCNLVFILLFNYWDHEKIIAKLDIDR